MLTIFLSHTKSDEALAREIAHQIQREIHGAEVFVSSKPDAIPSGDWLHQVLSKLDTADALIALNTPLSERSMWVAFEYGYFWGQNNMENLHILLHPKATIPGPLNTLQGKSVIDREELKVFFRELCSRLHLPYTESADLEAVVTKANSLVFETAEERVEKARLISRMGGADNALALDAVRTLRLHGWLTDGSLEGQTFTGANLHGADLKQAKLRGSKLNHADLREADFTYADLHGADLGGSKFQKISPDSPRAATLWHANAEDATLGSATLFDVNLGGTNLKGADLTAARLDGVGTDENTQFDNCILPDGSLWTPGTDMKRWTKRRVIH